MNPCKTAAILATLLLVVSAVPASAQRKDHRPSAKAPSAPPPAMPAPPPSPPPATTAQPQETKPYDPQLMRLAEILGALTYLRDLCGDKDADEWRGRMQALLDAEGSPQVRKDRLAGAYNRGIEGYGLSYRTCTQNAHAVIDRFLLEGERIAKEVENRYRAS